MKGVYQDAIAFELRCWRGRRQADLWGLMPKTATCGPQPTIPKYSDTAACQFRLKNRQSRNQHAGIIMSDQQIWVSKEDE